MITHKTKWLLVGLVCLALWPAHVSAQGGLWQTYIVAGFEAYQRGDYAEAETQLSAALKEAEGFGSQDPRLAASHGLLGEVYKAQGRYADAEPLLKRSLVIWEKAFGPEHPSVATTLNKLGGSTTPRASTPRLNLSTDGRWRSGRRRWDRIIPTWRRAWKTTPPCYVRPDALPRRRRWRPAPRRSGPSTLSRTR